MPTLYIVDGDSSGGTLKRALPGAPILIWRDALYEGPVPAGRSLSQLSRVRAGYWKSYEPKPLEQFPERDKKLRAAPSFDEVVLWFGPTVVCQLSLIQLLDWFSRRRSRKLTLIDHAYAGSLNPEQVRPHLDRRRPVTPAMLRTAVNAWKAFTSPKPDALKKFLDSEMSALPQLHGMLDRIAQEHPDPAGLSRIERKLLANFTRPRRAVEAVARVMRGETFGDTYYFGALDSFINGANQLLCFAAPPSADLRAAMLVLTDFGRKVLAGKADAIAFNGIDRWVGGVHFTGDRVPRR